jgi:hypothetical protein
MTEQRKKKRFRGNDRAGKYRGSAGKIDQGKIEVRGNEKKLINPCCAIPDQPVEQETLIIIMAPHLFIYTVYTVSPFFAASFKFALSCTHKNQCIGRTDRFSVKSSLSPAYFQGKIRQKKKRSVPVPLDKNMG